MVWAQGYYPVSDHSCGLPVRVRGGTYTEKRFAFVALWTCVAMVCLGASMIFRLPLLEAALGKFGIAVEPPSDFDKGLVSLIVVFFIYQTSRWAMAWNGLLTEEGHRARQNSQIPFFIIDGLRETLRILTRGAPPPVHQATEQDEPRPDLPPPLEDLPFREQVRELVLGKWAEYVIDDEDWIADAQCWRGWDTALDRPILLLCGVDETEADISRLQQQVLFLRADEAGAIPTSVERSRLNRPIRFLAVFDAFRDRERFNTQIADFGVEATALTFDELIKRVLPLGRYKQEIEKQFATHKLPNAPFAIGDIIVPTQIHETAIGSDGKIVNKGDTVDFDTYVKRWLSDASLRQLALLGAYGQGKSTAALELTYKLLHDSKLAASVGHRIPILIRLTGLSPKTTSPEGLLGDWGTRLGLNGRALLALHRAGRTVLIFDAFDEMAHVSDRADRFDHFAALWLFAGRGTKILFTGRPNFFLDDEELKGTLRIAESNAVGTFLSALRLAPFSTQQIEGSLRWMPEERIATFMSAVERMSQLEEIVRRPSLLFQVAQLWQQDLLDIESEEIQSASIIRKFIDYCIERQIAKQRSDNAPPHSGRQFIPLRKSELDYFTCGCAVAALSEGRNNSLPAIVFRRTIEELWQRLGERDLPVSINDDGVLKLPIKERLRDRLDAVEVCAQAVRTHGIIELDPAKSGVYKFSHIPRSPN